MINKSSGVVNNKLQRESYAININKSVIKNLKPGQINIDLLQKYNKERLQRIHDQSQDMIDMLKASRMEESRERLKIDDVVRTEPDYVSLRIINKGRVLSRMEHEYKKIDPEFQIRHYISEHEGLVEQYRLRQQNKKSIQPITEARICSLQKQIKTPLNMKKRIPPRTYMNSRENLLQSANESLCDREDSPQMNTTLHQRKQKMNLQKSIEISPEKLNSITHNMSVDTAMQERESIKIQLTNNLRRTIPRERVVDSNQKIKQNYTEARKKRSPLLFLFWKYNTLIQQNYDTSSTQMKDLVDFYSPIQESIREKAASVHITTIKPKKEPKKVHSVYMSPVKGFVDEAFYKNRPQTSYQKQMLDQMNETMYSSIEEVKDSVRRQIKHIDGRKKLQNHFVVLNAKLDSKLASHDTDIKDQCDVLSYMQDGPFLEEFVRQMKKNSTESIPFEFVLKQ